MFISQFLLMTLSSIIYIYIQISHIFYCIELKYDKWLYNIPKKTSGIIVVVQPSTCPKDSVRVSSWKSWAAEFCTVTKSSIADCVFFFFLIEELLCFGQGALSSAPPPWPFFMPYWPRCSHWALITALEMPLAHSAIFEDLVPLLSNNKGYCEATVSIMRVSARERELHCMCFT